MKKLLLMLCCAAVAYSAHAVFDPMEQTRLPRTPRSIVIGTNPQIELMKSGKVNFDIVVPPTASPTAKFIAKEMAEILKQTCGTAVKIVQSTPPEPCRHRYWR